MHHTFQWILKKNNLSIVIVTILHLEVLGLINCENHHLSVGEGHRQVQRMQIIRSFRWLELSTKWIKVWSLKEISKNLLGNLKQKFILVNKYWCHQYAHKRASHFWVYLTKGSELIRQHGQRDNSWYYNRILQRAIGDSIHCRLWPLHQLPLIEVPMNKQWMLVKGPVIYAKDFVQICVKFVSMKHGSQALSEPTSCPSWCCK